MTIYALVSEFSSVRLWSLDAGQRLRLQLSEISKESTEGLAEICWLVDVGDVPLEGQILLFNGHFLFENRTIKGVLDASNTVLLHGNESAAAFIDVDHLASVLGVMHNPGQQLPDEVQRITTNDLESFDITLRRSTIPLLEPVSSERKEELENELYGNAYRGITDLVTKFVWPRPAKQAVHVSANMIGDLSPLRFGRY
jgi:hypothetical protein